MGKGTTSRTPLCSPLAQHLWVIGSHSPSVQHWFPHANSLLQQPSAVYDCPAAQQPPPPAWLSGQQVPPTQEKPSGQQVEPQILAAGQQSPAKHVSQLCSQTKGG